MPFVVSSMIESSNKNCAAWGCTTVGKSGWGSSSNVDEDIRTKTGWSVDVLIHHYDDGYPFGYNNCYSAGASCWKDQQFVPICGTEG